MTMHNDDQRDDVDRKGGGRGLVNIEDSVDATMQRLEVYIKKKTWNKTDYSHLKEYRQHKY